MRARMTSAGTTTKSGGAKGTSAAAAAEATATMTGTGTGGSTGLGTTTGYDKHTNTAMRWVEAPCGKSNVFQPMPNGLGMLTDAFRSG